jgi:hypothetical protein
MASLAELPELVGFFSYSREDDQGSRGALSALRDAIQNELSAQLGRSQTDFRIWQDKATIPLGALWEREIDEGIKQAAFFIPIITPRALRSQNFAFEFKTFLDREAELGRDDLVFPILYISVPTLEDEKLWRDDPVLKIVGTRQYLDWRELRHHDANTIEVRQRLEQFCRGITKALHKQWLSPQERRQQEQTDARRRAEEEERRKTAAAEAERLALEVRQRQEAEAARRAEEAEQKSLENEAARQRAEEERLRLKAAAEKEAQEQRAFKAAKLASTLPTIDAFLAAHPDSRFAAEAKELRTAMQAREDARARAMTSDDPAVLRAFRDTYKKGDDVDQVRAQLRLLEPEKSRRTMKPALIAGALVVVLAGAAAVWFATRPNGASRPAIVVENPASTPPPALSNTPVLPTAQPVPITPPEPKSETKTETKAEASNSRPETPPATASTPEIAEAAGSVTDELVWSHIKNTNDVATLQRFTIQFPNSLLRKAAEARIAALAAVQTAWNLMKDSTDADQLRRFIQQFPSSPERSAAEQRLASITGVPAPPAPPPPPSAAIANETAATAPPSPPATALAVAAPAIAAPAATPEPHELARSLQFELMRVGCFVDKVTGQFDEDTKTAWHKFLKLTSKTMPDDVTPDAIGAVRQVNKRICPLVCGHGQHAEGEVCVVNEPPPPPKRAERRDRHEHEEAAPETAHAAPPASTPQPSRNTATPGNCYVDRAATSGSGYMRENCR